MERPSGLRPMRADDVKGRKRRVRKLGMLEVIMRMRRVVRRVRRKVVVGGCRVSEC